MVHQVVLDMHKTMTILHNPQPLQILPITLTLILLLLLYHLLIQHNLQRFLHFRACTAPHIHRLSLQDA